MFGLLDIKTCSIKKETKRYYACNVCNALSSNYGRTSRLLLTNDSVYLSLLIDAQRHESQFSVQTIKCNPWSKKALSYPEFEYPAAVSLLQSGVNLYDDIEDEKSVQAKILYFFYKNRVLQAERKLKSYGVSIPSIKSILENQQKRELNIRYDPDYYSFFTEQMYSKIFGQSAILADADYNYQYLADMGKDIGRIAYFLDGYMDFEQDRQKKRFNVFSKIKNSSSLNIKENSDLLNQIINEALYRIKDNISKVELYRHADKIRYIVTDGLKVRIQNILNGNGVWLTKPQIILGLVPFAFILMQMDGGECCPCGECEFEAGLCFPSGEASSSISFGDRIGSAAAEGIAGAAVGTGGAAIASGALSNTSGTAGASSENLSTETMKSQLNTVDFDSIPESSPEIEPLSMSPEEFETYKKKYWDKIRKEYVPAEAPSNFPLLWRDREIFRFFASNPTIPKDAKETLNKILEERQKNIKFDVKAEKERIERGISRRKEFLEIWNSRPKAFDEYYIHNCQKELLELMENTVKEGRTFHGEFFDIGRELSRSNNPEEREWVKKFQSIGRRIERFSKLKPYGVKGDQILGTADSRAYSSTAGTRA